jgi:hypothetical protein
VSARLDSAIALASKDAALLFDSFVAGGIPARAAQGRACCTRPYLLLPR